MTIKLPVRYDADKFASAVEIIRHYADEGNWQEPDANETVTYCVWKHLPDDGNELYNGYDKAAEWLKENDGKSE